MCHHDGLAGNSVDRHPDTELAAAAPHHLTERTCTPKERIIVVKTFNHCLVYVEYGVDYSD